MSNPNSSSPDDVKNTSTSASTISDFLPSLKTPGVQNIESAYSRAGAGNHHTPGYASTLGSQSQKPGSEGVQGVGSEKFKEGISDQRVEPSVVGKVFNNLINGTDQSK
ncbi:hypothetical protein BCIN_01g09640 [Botrytis cinerea B05.10]|uniref:Uncharacterized protein n=1 Tax=Botryotinia fuckeliana (strain B05.10) TaxID=332648 RepID=A0A384J748_BOTFB|nr:hypothetical protein BCIN_01g09640 [Botrytis cinerea B05.10]ATZ46353.1 hypothetical protein BCIN_01g09640 [Botrytis cinerea B05.10]